MTHCGHKLGRNPAAQQSLYSIGVVLSFRSAVREALNNEVRAAQVAALSVRHAIPASHERRAFPDAGGLMSYGSSQPDGMRLAGTLSRLGISRSVSQTRIVPEG